MCLSPRIFIFKVKIFKITFILDIWNVLVHYCWLRLHYCVITTRTSCSYLTVTQYPLTQIFPSPRFHIWVTHEKIIVLYLAYLIKHKELSCCHKWQDFRLFNGWIIFHCVYVPHFLYAFITCFHFLTSIWITVQWSLLIVVLGGIHAGKSTET
jgi:hypothetical protein